MGGTYDEVFLQEAAELLVDLEEALLELEDRPDDVELVARAFRAMHTIKGSGAMFGFDNVSAFTHEVETVFDRVRQGEIPVTKALVDVALAAKDHIRGLLEGAGDPGDGAALLVRLQEAVEGGDQAPAPAPAAEASGAPPEAPATGERSTYRIRFRPIRDLFARGTDPLLLLDELTQLGICRIAAHTDAIPLLDELDPEECHLYWDAVLTTDRGENDIRDVFIFVEDECELTVEVIDCDDPLEGNAEYKRLGDILVDRGDLAEDDLKVAVAGQKRVAQTVCNRLEANFGF